MIKRLATLIKRNIAANKLGLPFFTGIGKFHLPIKITNGISDFKINYPTNDSATSNLVFIEVFLDDCYQLNLLDGKINNVLDIGANMGFASLNILLRFNPDLLVCYEPNPDLIPILTKNCATARNCVIENKGMGKEEGKAFLSFTERDSEIVTGLTKTFLDKDGSTLIDSFNSVVSKYGFFDLVKMDCEGAEWDFLEEGMWKKVKYLTMEYHLSANDEKRDLTSLHKSLSLNFNIIQESKIDSLTGMILAKSKHL